MAAQNIPNSCYAVRYRNPWGPSLKAQSSTSSGSAPAGDFGGNLSQEIP